MCKKRLSKSKSISSYYVSRLVVIPFLAPTKNLDLLGESKYNNDAKLSINANAYVCNKANDYQKII